MFKKIIWALLELVTIGSGTYIFVSTMVNEDYVDNEVAGGGAFMIILGLLLRNWRMTLFIKEEKSETSKVLKSEIQNRSVHTLLVLVLSFSLFVLNRKINNTSLRVNDNESDIENLDYQVNEFDEIENRLDNVEAFEERIENLENYSHGHYY